ncbi:hypothetical protein MCEKH45_01943 [Methylophilaceae bacterium]
MSKEFDGIRIKNWIERSSADYLELLNGCELSNESSIWEIVEITNNTISVAEVENTNHIKKFGLDFLIGKTVFVPKDKLKLIEEIEQKKSPSEVLEDEAESILRKYSISISSLGGGATVLKFAIILNGWDKNQIIPDEDELIYFYEYSKKSKEISKAVLPIIRKWCDLRESEIKTYDAFLRLNLAVLLRVSGKFDESLEVSKIIDLSQTEFKCGSRLRSMICCDRAAVFLDKFERNRNSDYLNQAEKYLKRAFANEQSEEVSSCYHRYRAYLKSLTED